MCVIERLCEFLTFEFSDLITAFVFALIYLKKFKEREEEHEKPERELQEDIITTSQLDKQETQVKQ